MKKSRNHEIGKSPTDFVPRRGLRSAHLQTIFGNFLPRTNLLPPGERRRFVVAEHETGAKIEVECVCHWQTQPAKRRSSEASELLSVIIVHGLEGSVDSQYVIGTGSKAWAAGMNVIRMNMRNCGDTESLTPTLYHSGLSADVGAVAKELIDNDGLQRIAIVGFSMGGNLVMKLAGEWGGDAPPQVKAFAAVSPAMDLAASADALHARSNWLYEQRFLRSLRRSYERKAVLFPNRYDLAHLRRFASIREFDHEITARYEGFAGADDYYERSSAARVVERIRVPTLVLHAQDDPFIRLRSETTAKLMANPAVTFIEAKHGGHCAFLATPNGYDGRWAERTVIEFLSTNTD
ncbi:MAG TPA: alpha/beta fold hydrolase [Terriglobales bacterium]|nr:alpha/beta fold hydrolase [Terriglobales bacterium]